ncbi:MAG: aminoglycoside phosphotransferase family protein [Clostridia bacterium]|nr:aminoglycoside phosphotransferase family protein [Clostridia bacterium]
MNNEETQLKAICQTFCLRGEYQGYEVINSGHINTTYRVFYQRDGVLKDYIVQQVNTYVFQDPVGVMENISAVTEFIRAKIKQVKETAKRNVLHYKQTADGKYYTLTEDGGFWRCCRYIDESVCFLKPENLKVIEESGKAFGEFQLQLADFPVEKLSIVIPHFHNTIRRYDAFRDAIAENAKNRVAELAEEIEGYLALEELATKPYRLQREGVLPLRVTHNDTKTSNVLFDAKTFEHLSVIDLDTVMPGLVAFDFGDAIRVAASTGEEDERDLSTVAVDMEKYEAFTRGFVREIGDFITEAEKASLALGAVAMTVECGVRFLTDYINGDIYFKIHYPDQNLVRAKCHLKLARDMITHLDEMQAIVDKYFNENK